MSEVKIDEMVLLVQEWLNDTYTGRTGYNPLDLENESIKGRTGWPTMYALTRALQIELNIGTPSDNFGSGTLAALANYGDIGIDKNNSNENIVKIIQGALFCKGYNAGGITGTFGENTTAAITSMKENMGLINPNGYVTPKVFKALLTMDAYVIVGTETEKKVKIRAIQQWLNNRYINRQNFYFQPCDGNYSRNTQKALVYAIQFEEGLRDGVANGNFGPTTKANLPTLRLGSADSSTQFVHLLQAALVFNNRLVDFNGIFGEDTKEKVIDFQSFTKLSADGIAGKQTWASLLVSTGDPSRKGTACDCISEITAERAATLLANGYRTVGRYLTNVEGSSLNKKIQPGEIDTILNAGLTIFPIFQTYGGSASYFNFVQGVADASAAYYAAREHGFKEGTTIYFAVDYDTMDNEITNCILPHFRGINERMSAFGSYYKIGVYGTRNVCMRVSDNGLAETSFLSDMSTGFSGNLGFTLPENWAFDQISTVSLGSGNGAIEIDNDIQSGLDMGVSSVDSGYVRPTYLDDYYLHDEQKEALISEVSSCVEEIMNGWQDFKSVRTTVEAATLVYEYDDLITELSNKYKLRKALIQTVFMWEASAEGADDTLKDTMVVNYYQYMRDKEYWDSLSVIEQALVPMPTYPTLADNDGSTGYCQIFAKTAIEAHNYAIDQGIITGEKYDYSDWHDVDEVWSKLHGNPEYCISSCALVLIHAASMVGLDDNYYAYDEEDNKKVIARYNGTNADATAYGERNYAIYEIYERYNSQVR